MINCGPHHVFRYTLLLPVVSFFGCGNHTKKPDDKVVNVIHHNEVFQTEIANDLNEEGLKFAHKMDYDNALHMFSVALEYEKNNPTLLNNLGLTEKALEDNEMASYYFEKAIKADTAYYSAYTNYGLVLFEMKEYDKSLELLNKAIKYSKSQMILGSAHLHAAFVYLETNDCEKAKTHFEKAKAYSPKSEETEEQNKEFEKKLKECK
jgi:tetratricopeptide (TPR) repeat protein